MSVGVLIPIALCVLALLDGAFASFRAASGQTAALPSLRANAISHLWGIAAALVGLVCIAAATVPLLAPVATRTERYDAMVAAGAVLLVVYTPMALVNLVAILCYLTATYELRTLATIVVLGPFTMLRPVVIAFGAVLAIVWVADPIVVPGVVVAAVVTIGLGPALSWIRFRRHWPTWNA